ncbi:protein CDV3 homolog isoform X1 [Cimex lectularius]|uniref:Protein CDV3 homolog n=2 Tax=Cimex lectularius TaxID=79782 RepID=A0A8I6S8P7_CIMLE|nr:protein CDV3 homolog isoform X1 [Cimex lectularius]
MADLDDFFAKKDRKKSKGKKFATADEIAKKLEETGKRTEKLKKEKLQTSQLGSQEVDEQGNTVQDEDEWREFEEEKKDYSGLKIQNLTLAEYDSMDEGGSGGEGEDEGGMEENEAGELVPKKKNGPWRVVPNPAAGDDGNTEESTPNQAPPPTQNTGSYVPPALRNLASKQQQMPFNAWLRRKIAPDVRSEELFPTLSAANTQESAVSSSWGKRKGKDEFSSGAGGFEEVKNSRSHTAKYEPFLTAPARGDSLALGNKFGALDSE